MGWFQNLERGVESFFGVRQRQATGALKGGPSPEEPAPATAPEASAPATRLLRDQSQVNGSQRLSTLALTTAAPTESPTIAGLQNQIRQLLGPGVQFTATGGSQWSVQDLQGLLKAAQALPASARPALANTTFIREPVAPDGSCDVAQTDFCGNERLGGPLTISFTDAASKSGQIEDVAVHEFGHAAIGGGRFNPDAIREFGKLSHFVESNGQMVDGHDQSGLESTVDPGAKPLNTTNFVQDVGTNLAEGSAEEDFAESFRNYVLHPDALMAAAPDKFLYLNAQYGKYPASQVQTLAANNKVDLPVVMAELRGSDLRPETLAKIGQTQGLTSAGTSGTAAGNMIAAVTANLSNATFLQQFRSGNAQQALGPAIWGRLSKSEQSLLAQPAYASKLVATVQANSAAPKDDVTDGDVQGMREFASLLVQPPSDAEKIAMFFDPGERFKYVEGLIHNPQVWNNLDPSFKALIDSPKGQDTVRYICNNQNFDKLAGQLWGGVKMFGLFNVGPTQDPKVISNFKANISRIGPAEVQTAEDLAKSDNHKNLDTLSRGLLNLGQALDTANAASQNMAF